MYFEEGGEEIGAVRVVNHDHVVVYIEGAGDFVVEPAAVKGAHDGKLLLDAAKADPKLVAAAKHAHERETE